MNPTAKGVEFLISAAAGQCDLDPVETREWLEALDAVVAHAGGERAQYLFDRLADHALQRGVQSARARVTPYRNSIPLGARSRTIPAIWNWKRGSARRCAGTRWPW